MCNRHALLQETFGSRGVLPDFELCGLIVSQRTEVHEASRIAAPVVLRVRGVRWARSVPLPRLSGPTALHVHEVLLELQSAKPHALLSLQKTMRPHSSKSARVAPRLPKVSWSSACRIYACQPFWPTVGSLRSGLRGVVLVEGTSDRRAVEALARRRGRDLEAEGVAVVPMGGYGNLPRLLERVPRRPTRGPLRRRRGAAFPARARVRRPRASSSASGSTRARATSRTS